jgi:hypothetical protein
VTATWSTGGGAASGRPPQLGLAGRWRGLEGRRWRGSVQETQGKEQERLAVLALVQEGWLGGGGSGSAWAGYDSVKRRATRAGRAGVQRGEDGWLGTRPQGL